MKNLQPTNIIFIDKDIRLLSDSLLKHIHTYQHKMHTRPLSLSFNVVRGTPWPSAALLTPLCPDLTALIACSICSLVHCFHFTFACGDLNAIGVDLVRFLDVRCFLCPRRGKTEYSSPTIIKDNLWEWYTIKLRCSSVYVEGNWFRWQMANYKNKRLRYVYIPYRGEWHLLNSFLSWLKQEVS